MEMLVGMLSLDVSILTKHPHAYSTILDCACVCNAITKISLTSMGHYQGTSAATQATYAPYDIQCIPKVQSVSKNLHTF